MTKYLGGRRKIHPDAKGVDLTLSGVLSALNAVLSGDLSVADDGIFLGGVSVGSSDNPLAGQLKLGVAAGSGYLTFYPGSYVPGHIDGSELLFDISGAEALKLLSSGHLRLRNNKLLKSLNAAGNADLDLIGRNSSDGLVLGSGLSGVLKASSSVVSAAGLLNADVDAAADIAMTKLQPYEFLAVRSSQVVTATGDATTYTILFNSEIYDVGSAYNPATGVFTAPVTGKYHFDIAIALAGLAAGHTIGYPQLVTSNKTYRGLRSSYGAMRDNTNSMSVSLSITCDMDANDTASVTIVVGGSTKVVAVDGDGTVGLTYFSGHQVG